MTYEIFLLGPEVYIPYLLLSLAITILAYGAFPVLFAVLRRKPITAKKYMRLCYVFNFLIAVFFLLGKDKATIGFPYILWTSVFENVGRSKLEKRGLLAEDDKKRAKGSHRRKLLLVKKNVQEQKNRLMSVEKVTEPRKTMPEKEQEGEIESDPAAVTKLGAEEAEATIETVELASVDDDQTRQLIRKKSKQRFCKYCGGPIDEISKKCSGCGKQYFRMPRITVRRVWTIVTMMLFVVNVGLIVACVNLKKDNTKYEEEINSLNAKLVTANSQADTFLTLWSNSSEKSNFLDRYVVLVPDDDTNLYHKYGCKHMSGSSFWIYNTEAAKAKRYSACPYCN